MTRTGRIARWSAASLIIAVAIFAADDAVSTGVGADDGIVPGRFDVQPTLPLASPDPPALARSAVVGVTRAESHARVDATPKPDTRVGSGLRRLYEERVEAGPLGPESAPEYVVIDSVSPAGSGDALLVALESIGLVDGSSFGNVVSGRLPISAIPALDAIPGLKRIERSLAVLNTGSVLSQGDTAQRSNLLRLRGVDGTGVTIGILSDSYDCDSGEAADITSGDLPNDVTVLQEETGCTSGTDEGRAMAQLVYDVAPGADILFHSAFLGSADFAQGIIDLQVAGADVIVDDVSYLNEPMFQDGIIAQAVDTVVAAGVAYFSSAGNETDKSYESVFRNSGVSSGGGLAHDFLDGAGVDTEQRMSLNPGERIRLAFQWDDPHDSAGGAAAQTDMDIYILDTSGGVLASSTDANIGGDPFEFVQYSSGSAVEVDIQIVWVGGPAPELIKYVNFDADAVQEYDTQSGTTYGHANAAGAIAVGAARFLDTPAFGTSPPVRETFSARGGVPILFDTAGIALSSTSTRAKPEIVGPDGGNTTFFGNLLPEDGDNFPNFFGTSAAAPHVAAAAALMLDGDPTLTPAEILSALQTTAIDMNTNGFDYDTGFGLVDTDTAFAFATGGTSTAPRPLNVVAIGEAGQATVDWDAPAFDGNSTTTEYLVTSSPGGLTATTTADVTIATVTGLTGGTSYTFTVASTNGFGLGPESLPSSAVLSYPAGFDSSDPDQIPDVTVSFEGINDAENGTNNSIGFVIPPDPMGAVGPDHVVTVTNNSIEIHSKTGEELSSEGFKSFFSGFGLQATPFDPKVRYDQYRSRFVVVVLEGSSLTPDHSQILIAVSDDSNPLGTWHKVAIDAVMDIGGTNHWVDFPGLGLDEDAVYITGNMFPFGAGSLGGVRLWILNKDSFYGGGGLSSTVHDPWDAIGEASLKGTTFPAHGFGSLPGNVGTFLVRSGLSLGSDTYLTIIQVTDPLGSPSFGPTHFLNLGEIDDLSIAIPDAPQPNSSTLIQTNDGRILDVVWRNNSLWGAFNVVPPAGPDAGQATAHWVRVTTSNLNSLTLADQGNAGGNDIDAGAHTFFPSLAVDKDDNLAIGFALSSPNHYGGAYYSGRLSTDPAGTTRNTGVIRVGDATYDPTNIGFSSTRWGDYSGIALDPSNEAHFWAFNEYARDTDQWGTYAGQFTFTNTPGPPQSVAASVDHSTATVTVNWSAPSDDGGVAIDSYTVVSLPPTVTATVSAGSSTAQIPGLVFGVEYRFWVTAENDNGPGVPTASNPVTQSFAPDAPTAVIATPLVESALVSWDAPTDDGGTPVTGYTVLAAPGGATSTVPSSSTSTTVSGLTNGVSYTFTVKATNLAGTGASSTPSNAVVPGPGISFASELMVLVNVGESATTTIQVEAVASTTDRVFANLKHGPEIEISNLECVGVFAGSASSTVSFNGGISMDCDLGVSDVSGVTGDAIEFLVLRVAPGKTTISFELETATSTAFFASGSSTAPVVAGTLTVAEGIEVTGTIFAPGFADVQQTGATVVLTSVPGGATSSAGVDSGGAFTFDAVVPGQYTASVSARGFLSVQSGARDLFDVTEDLGTVTLRGGDVNGDAFVNTVDFAIMAGVFGLSLTLHPILTDFRVDLSGDEFVNTVDFAIAAGNFGVGGPTAWP